MSRRNRKRDEWSPVTGPEMVGLLEPLLIEKWGYEINRETVLAKLYEEAVAHHTGEPQKRTVWLERQPHLYIAQYHPKFEGYWGSMPGELGKLLPKELDFRLEVDLIHGIHHRVVETYVRNIVSKSMVAGTERKLFTKSVFSVIGPCTTSPAWRGPWRVLGQRVVKTGTYQPASGGGYDYFGEANDYYPACLGNPKTHVILKVEAETGVPLDGQCLFFDRANTVDWACMKTADRLMEAS